jgi:outer membrane protein assembly factor BamE (lipoprotein component of BamABCDE complex)
MIFNIFSFIIFYTIGFIILKLNNISALFSKFGISLYFGEKQNIFILILTLFPIISLLLYVYSHGEGYCVIYPSIDTVYANHFSKKGFEKVELGMSKDTVISLIGMPLFYEKQQNNEEIFFYSMDGACSLGGYQYADFAWLSYSITFKDQKVISKDIHIYYD